MLSAALAAQAGETDRPLRILQFVTNLRFGGAEKLTTDLSIALREQGHEVTVAAWTDGHDALAQRLREHDVPVAEVAFPKPGVWALKRTILDVKRLIRQFEPDIVHAHNPAAGTIALAARGLARKGTLPVVTTYHGVRPHRLRLASRLMSGADAVIAVGPSAAEQLRLALPQEHVVEINNAVDPQRSRATADVRAEFVADGGVLLAAVGRCVPEKGQMLLIEAVAELRRRGSVGPRVTLVIVGYGPLQEQLEVQAASLDLADRVIFAGARADAADIIGSADVLVHGSYREGLPLVLLEAMLLEVPVVAVDATGVSDVVRDRETGLLVEQRDPAAFADAVEEMLLDDALRAGVVSTARAMVVDEYPVSEMVAQHVELYGSLVDGRAAPPAH